MTTVLGFVLLAAVGALARWQLTRLSSRQWPGGTLVANVGAAFLLGALAGASSTVITVVGVGLLGSYSTFSTLIREVVDVGAAANLRQSIMYLATTLVLGIGAAAVGLELSSS